MLRTTGLTYAEYARSGFWQLLAVTVLALGVLAARLPVGPGRHPGRAGLEARAARHAGPLTLVIVVSAINRMWLYQQAYGFTVLRLLVLTCELWLGAGFLLALVAVLRLRPAGLTRPMVAAGMLALLGLAALNPERFVAEHNVARWSETGRIDADYLGTPLGRRGAAARRAPRADALLRPGHDRRPAPGAGRRLAQREPGPRRRPGPARPRRHDLPTLSGHVARPDGPTCSPLRRHEMLAAAARHLAGAEG